METTQERLDNADQLGIQLIRFLRLLERATHQFSDKPHGVEKAGYMLMAHLVMNGPKRASALADAVHSDPSTVSRQVAQLVRAGLLERRADPQDGRACLLAATDKGSQLFDDMRAKRSLHLDQMLASWPLDRRQQLVELFDALNTDIENYRPQMATAIAEQRKATR
ncbi:MarR family winged helix-turn-helix transcriptional regulator [Kutzneria chonburiensis]|uniref:MarR family winged helix-turn-helix transcriptional regulator n=1 Tax=Kutzneria chonburiensis TaxID=1483604 RepID=A0ABV6MWZ6_9PSEU|nr:MarR family winged helix-turn-helix transcriptional regulator [Kutzneria chonburiensis]